MGNSYTLKMLFANGDHLEFSGFTSVMLASEVVGNMEYVNPCQMAYHVSITLDGTEDDATQSLPTAVKVTGQSEAASGIGSDTGERSNGTNGP